MKKCNKKILILSILLVFLIMGAASAASDDVNTTLSDDSNSQNIMTQQDSVKEIDTVSLDTEDKISSDASDNLGVTDSKSFKELNDTINNRQKVTINLNDDYIFDNETDHDFINGIFISRSHIVINGNNHIIDANGESKIFNITGHDITFNNIIFKNMNGSGGAIYANFDSYNINVNLCKFDTSNYTIDYGVIAYQGLFGTLNVTSSNFTNLLAGDHAGAIGILSDAVVIEPDVMFNRNLIVDNCYFNNVSSTGSGGAIGAYAVDNILVSNSHFNSTSSYWGGAITVDSSNNFTVKNCTFNNSSGDRSPFQLNNLNLYLINCNFTNCVSSYSSIIALNNNCNGTIEGCSFSNNSAPEGVIFEGSLSNSTLNVSGSTFKDNPNTVPIINKETANIAKDNIIEYSFDDEFAQFYYTSISQNNIVELDKNYNCTFPLLVFKSNAIIDGKGHTIYCYNNMYIRVNSANTTIKNVNLVNINITNTILIWNGHNGTVISSKFINVSGDRVIGWNGENGTVRNSTFYNNNLTGLQGGVIALNSLNGVVSNCTFDSNYNHHELGWGKLLRVNAANCTIKDCNFIDNYADQCMIYWAGANGTVTNCNFTHNDKVSAALLWSISSALNLNMSYLKFYDETGIACRIESGNSTIDSCKFENTSLGLSWSGANGTASNLTFINTTNRCVLWEGANGTVINSKFNNVSLEKASANCVYWRGENGIIRNSTFKNIHSINGSYFNGIVLTWIGFNGVVSNCTFDSNLASYDRPWCKLIDWFGNNGTIEYCNFTNNTMDQCIVHSRSGSTLTISHSSFNDTQGQYELFFDGEFTLLNNTINSENGVICVSPSIRGHNLICTIMNNENIITEDSNILLNASLTDDNNNKIIIPYFIINGEHVSAQYNDTTGRYQCNLVIADDEFYTVRIPYSDNCIIISKGKVSIDSVNISVDNVYYPNKPIAVVNATVDGEYIIEVQNKKYFVNVKEGTGTVTLDILDAKEYTATVSFNNTVINSTKFNVNKGYILGSINISDAIYNMNYSANVTVNQSGKYKITIGDFIKEVELRSGKNIIKDLPILNSGDYTITLTPTSTNYQFSNSSQFKILKASPDFQTIVNDVKIDQNITVTIINTNNATGKVEVKFNGATKYIDLDNNETIVSFESMPVGEYNITINYKLVNYNSTIKSFKVSYYTAKDLQQLIYDAQDAGNTTVNLDKNFIFEEGEESVMLPENMAINGNNHTIDANGTSNGIFNIPVGEVTIDGLNLINSNGSAIVGNGSNIKINNTSVKNSNGTAIDIQGDDVVVSNVNLTNIEKGIAVNGTGNATISGVSVNGANGTAIDVTADNVKIENTDLTNVNGDAVKVNATTGDATIYNVDITNASGKAIDVAANGDVNITGSDLNNVTQGISVKSDEGSVEVSNVTADTIHEGTAIEVTGNNVTVKNTNVSNVNGPGIVANATSGDVNITGVEVSDVNGTGIDAN